MNNAINQGSPLRVKLTREQEGGILGALAASVGIQLSLKVLAGKGMQINRKGHGLGVLSPGIANQVSYDQMAILQKEKGS